MLTFRLPRHAAGRVNSSLRGRRSRIQLSTANMQAPRLCHLFVPHPAKPGYAGANVDMPVEGNPLGMSGDWEVWERLGRTLVTVLVLLLTQPGSKDEARSSSQSLASHPAGLQQSPRHQAAAACEEGGQGALPVQR